MATEATLPLRWTRPAAAMVMSIAIALFAVGHFVGGKNTGGALIALPVLLPIAHVLIRRFAASETRFDLIGLLWFALSCKMVATYVRFLGVADANVYDQVGADLAASFRSGDFLAPTGKAIPGTGTIRYLTGVLHLFTNSSFIATFILFSLLSFVGLVLSYRAFVMAVPEGAHQRYAMLVLLWPTLLYWPSSIGKEAVMVLGLGLASYGSARVLVRRSAGFWFLAMGLFISGMVRPHVALILITSITIALVLRAPLGSGNSAGFAKAIGVAFLLVVGLVLARETADLLQVEDLGAGIEIAEQRTSQGGAQFSAARVRGPLDIPRAVGTVLFRPFIWEAHSGPALMSAAEGMFLMGLIVLAGRRVAARFKEIRREAYLALVITYTATFCFVFAAIGNFGILTRQRSQLLPLLLVLAALPATAARPTRGALRRQRTAA